MDTEWRFHLDARVDTLVSQGVPKTEAERRARYEFGDPFRWREQGREARGLRWFEEWRSDVVCAWRQIRRGPLFAGIIVGTLALGIGANLALFSIVNSLLFRRLPVSDPGRLVLLKGIEPAGVPEWSYPVLDQIRQRPQLFDGVLAWSSTRFDLASGGETDFVEGLWTSGSFFQVLGVPPAIGRTLSEADDRSPAGADGLVAVISDGFWKRRFGGTADVIGRTLSLDRVAFTIVGVTPPRFFGPEIGRTFDVAVPAAYERLLRERVGGITIMARLRSDQTLDAAMVGLRGVQSQIRDATLPEAWPPQERGRYLQQGFTLSRRRPECGPRRGIRPSVVPTRDRSSPSWPSSRSFC
jgi:putative ABC transport system permease protein